jgi:outer membrane protein insertion porin family
LISEALSDLRPGEPVAWDRLADGLSEALRAHSWDGYLGASTSVHVEEGDSTSLTIRGESGARMKWGSVVANARHPGLLREGAEQLARLQGRPCTAAGFNDAVGRLLEVHSWNGYPFALAIVESLALRGDLVDAGLTVEPGALVRWGILHPEGAVKTKPSTVARIVGFKSGVPFDSRLLDNARSRLVASGLFAWVGYPALRGTASPDTVDVEMPVKEARASSATGAVGYVPPRGQQDGYFVGRAELILENMAGTGRSADFSWRRTAPGASSMSLGYREPWFLGTPFSVTLALSQDVRDTSYTRRKGQVEVGARVGGRLTAGLGASGERITPAERAEGLFPASVKYEGSVHLTWEGRDSPVLAESGWLGDVAASYGHRRTETDSVDESFPEAVFRGHGEVYLSAGRAGVLAVGGSGSALLSDADELPLPLQFPLGGAESLRGYREEQFRGSSVGWINADLRLLRWAQGALGPFLDTGYYYLSTSRGGRGGRAKIGYGIALRSMTRLGLLRLDYGVGEDTDLLGGRVHVSLRAMF